MLFVEVLEVVLNNFPRILRLVQVFNELLSEVDVQRCVDIALQVLVLGRDLLVDHDLDVEWFHEGLPDAYVDVEEVDRRVQVRPNALLLLIEVPVHSEVREV